MEELTNPHPDIHELFCYYNDLYFEGKLGACTVAWSTKRMTLCAGLCKYCGDGACDIRLSEPLLKFRPASDLKETLLHEMIHAYLFLTNGNKDHDDHGSCFQHLMMEINHCDLPDKERPHKGYSITIFHGFKDEVDYHRVHHWTCEKCGQVIKRAMNRPPSQSDCASKPITKDCTHPRCLWHRHQNTCGGIYVKTQEPEGYKDKRKHVTTAKDGAHGSTGETGKIPPKKSGGKRKSSVSEKEVISKKGSFGENELPSAKDRKNGKKQMKVEVKSSKLDDFYGSVEKDAARDLVSMSASMVKVTESVMASKQGKLLSWDDVPDFRNGGESSEPIVGKRVRGIDLGIGSIGAKRSKFEVHHGSVTHFGRVPVVSKWKGMFLDISDEDTDVEPPFYKRLARQKQEKEDHESEGEAKSGSPSGIDILTEICEGEVAKVQEARQSNKECEEKADTQSKCLVARESSEGSRDRKGPEPSGCSDLQSRMLNMQEKYSGEKFPPVIVLTDDGNDKEEGMTDPSSKEQGPEDTDTPCSMDKTKMCKTQKRLGKDIPSGSHGRSTNSKRVGRRDGKAISGSPSDGKVWCPVCNNPLPDSIRNGDLNKHIDECLGLV